MLWYFEYKTFIPKNLFRLRGIYTFCMATTYLLTTGITREPKNSCRLAEKTQKSERFVSDSITIEEISYENIFKWTGVSKILVTITN